MEKVWKALIGLVIIFTLLSFGVAGIGSLPSWMPPDLLLFLLFVMMATVVVWMLR